MRAWVITVVLDLKCAAVRLAIRRFHAAGGFWDDSEHDDSCSLFHEMPLISCCD